ncbi:hypothetical protein [Persicitalea jodogahamensis]|uniref:Uncharacterized protein n=1 Tax=Persicitalea jodogahamensis TaxID=402147 RepID=A0A8J3D5T9_9BACT|nr:hypothetical protein [Persicitalea jodogahamensis]GHB87278.1 hypothetical protein GCM10007390_48840 [Persicitalea jodogahamensis]
MLITQTTTATQPAAWTTHTTALAPPAAADAAILPQPCPYCGSEAGEYEAEDGYMRCYDCGGM